MNNTDHTTPAAKSFEDFLNKVAQEKAGVNFEHLRDFDPLGNDQNRILLRAGFIMGVSREAANRYGAANVNSNFNKPSQLDSLQIERIKLEIELKKLHLQKEASHE
jgi:hypothetical protein